MLSDEEIVRLVQNGDKERFGEIVDRYETKLSGYIRHLINQPDEEIEDLVQEVFISSYTNIQGFDSRKKFSSWIYRIAHNKAIDYFKKKKLKRTTVIDEDSEEFLVKDEKLVEELLIEKEEKEKLFQSISQLEFNFKEVLLLYYYEEKSYDEISDVLHIPVSNVGVLLYRAKAKLKKFLISNDK